MPGGMPRFYVRVLRVQLPVLLHPDLPLIDNSCNLEPGCLLSTGVRVTHAPWRPHLPLHSGGILGAATPAPLGQADLGGEA